MAKQHGNWDLTALLNAAQSKATRAQRHLWLVRLLEWLRHPAPRGAEHESSQPLPLLRLRHLLQVLERNPDSARAVQDIMAAFWREIDALGLFAYVGFAPRMVLWGELLNRMRQNLLPGTVDTADLGELFHLLFPQPEDEQWLLGMDEDLLRRLGSVLTPALADGDADSRWRQPMLDSITVLASAVRSTGLSAALRQRMSPELIADQPFVQLARATERVTQALQERDEAALAQDLQYLRALLEACQRAALSSSEHLEAYGISVDIVFEIDQLVRRCQRIEALLDCLVSDTPQQELARLAAGLVRVVHEQRSMSSLFAQHYSMLARKVAERSAATGEHYITRTAAEYRDMLLRAAGGGGAIAITTFVKFALMALTLSAFWSGFWAGVNYAACFVLIHVLHWTVATKQPAMTAPAMAHKLKNIDQEAELEDFVDEVAHLLRSQFAGIVGNLACVIPVVLAGQGLGWLLLGAPLVGRHDAEHVLDTLHLLGPTLFFSAFTGVLLFASSLIAGWAENWFVFHRLDSAIAWNPTLVARLGEARAQRWALWWRNNISGLAANISLGFLLGLVPVLLAFFGLGIEVRHVTLSTGQLAAAVGALGVDVFRHGAFWWCLASIPFIGLLNLGVSFWLALKVALRSRGVKLADRARLRAAIWRRLRTEPRSFVLPPREPNGA
nr:site-specific recombinase [uncultured Roseateles sp.]